MRLARAVSGVGKDDSVIAGGGDEGLVVGSLRICIAEAGTAVKPYSVIGFADIVTGAWNQCHVGIFLVRIVWIGCSGSRQGNDTKRIFGE